MLRRAVTEAVQRQPAGTRPRQVKDGIIARRGTQAKNTAKVAAARELLTTLVFYGMRDGHIRRASRAGRIRMKNAPWLGSELLPNSGMPQWQQSPPHEPGWRGTRPRPHGLLLCPRAVGSWPTRAAQVLRRGRHSACPFHWAVSPLKPTLPGS